jgi:hypothetical protein
MSLLEVLNCLSGCGCQPLSAVLSPPNGSSHLDSIVHLLLHGNIGVVSSIGANAVPLTSAMANHEFFGKLFFGTKKAGFDEVSMHVQWLNLTRSLS